MEYNKVKILVALNSKLYMNYPNKYLSIIVVYNTLEYINVTDLFIPNFIRSSRRRQALRKCSISHCLEN